MSGESNAPAIAGAGPDIARRDLLKGAAALVVAVTVGPLLPGAGADIGDPGIYRQSFCRHTAGTEQKQQRQNRCFGFHRHTR